MAHLNPPRQLREAAARLLEAAGPAALAACAEAAADQSSAAALASRLGRPDATEAIARVLAAAARTGAEPAASYLHGLADGAAHRSGRVQAVWTGPAAHEVPVRSTLGALLDLVGQARSELWLSTYSASPHQRLREAVAAAVRRGAAVSILIETLGGAGSAISGSEPSLAFAGLDGVRLYTWPKRRRPAEAKLHAKLALADRTRLLVTSANFTGHGLEHNLEAGLLVHGGAAPARTAEHLDALLAGGTLERIG